MMMMREEKKQNAVRLDTNNKKEHYQSLLCCVNLKNSTLFVFFWILVFSFVGVHLRMKESVCVSFEKRFFFFLLLIIFVVCCVCCFFSFISYTHNTVCLFIAILILSCVKIQYHLLFCIFSLVQNSFYSLFYIWIGHCFDSVRFGCCYFFFFSLKAKF